MGVIELLILAVGLSMDAFAVSVCKGLAMKKAGAKELCIVGCWFGGFQALMPLIGWAAGSLFQLICHPVSMQSINAPKPSWLISAFAMSNTETGRRLSFFKPGD